MEEINIGKLYDLVWEYCSYLNHNVFSMYGSFTHATSINRQGIPKSKSEVQILNFQQLHTKVDEIIIYVKTFKLKNDMELAKFHERIPKVFDSYIQNVKKCNDVSEIMRENSELKIQIEKLKKENEEYRAKMTLFSKVFGEMINNEKKS